MSDGVQLCMTAAVEIIEQADKERYEAFTDKFKPKRTTDDCCTPARVYEAVADWVAAEYGKDRDTFVRPFWPGGDYERFEYPEGCVVVDNPPFSLNVQIQRFYLKRGIDFFIFGPSLTLFSGGMEVCYVVADADIEYQNGAIVRTGFITSMEPETRIRSAPALYRAIRDAVEAERKEKRVELPKYSYPDAVCTAAMVQRYSHYGVDFRVRAEDCLFIRGLDEQKHHGKDIFGGGYLLSERAAAERAAAERAAEERAAAERAAEERAAAKVWTLSEREMALQRELGKE